MDITIEEPRGDNKWLCMTQIQQVIVQGTIKNPDDYKITSGNKWLNNFENIKVVHEDFKRKQVSFVICWKNGHINRWEHDFELSSGWTLTDVILTYIDKKGHTILQVRPTEFRFHYNISRNGIIKNWKLRKKDFTSILRWSLNQVLD